MLRRLLVPLVGLLLAACASPGDPPSPTPPPAVALPAKYAPLTELVRNMQVQLVANDRHPTVQLANGVYHADGDPAADPFADVRVPPQPMAFGDLNGDGVQDAAALLAENYGGSGVFVSVLAALSRDGQAIEAGAALIDDRPDVTSLEIRDGRIELQASLHGPQDPACCAAWPVSQSYALSGSGLVLRRMSSVSADGTQRSLSIDEPQDGGRARSGPLHLSGRLSASPAGGTLRLRIFDDATGEERVVAAMPASGSQGQPAGFDATVDLSSIAAGTRIRIEVADVSPSEGNPLALDSVIVMIE